MADIQYTLEGGDGTPYPSYEEARIAQVALATQGIETGAIVPVEEAIAEETILSSVDAEEIPS